MQQSAATISTAFARSRMPIYAQIASLLRQCIEAGRLRPSDRLPPLKALQDEFGVARVTARQAVNLIEADGLVWRKRGEGTLVKAARPALAPARHRLDKPDVDVRGPDNDRA